MSDRMKVVSWNVNGIRSLRKDVAATLNDLAADIVCFQETKISKEQMTEKLAVVDGHRSYFSFCKTRSGYSGVATYCTKDTQPINAADSLTTPLSEEEELSFSFSPDVLKLLDCEGRTVITQHALQTPVDGKSLLTIINVYCPCVTGERDGRESFRLQFLQTLEERVSQLKKTSLVVLLGDINVSHRPIDHCEPGDEAEFNSQPHRMWLDRMLDGEKGGLMDTFRVLHPEQRFAYTCWNTKIGARQTNYGTRIDYILITKNMQASLTTADVLAKYLGSDHCPVLAVFDISVRPSTCPPPLCTSHKYKAKQQKLTFFMTGKSAKPVDVFDSVPPAGVQNAPPSKRKKKSSDKRNALNAFVKKSKSPEPIIENLSQSSSASELTQSSDPSQSSQTDEVSEKPPQKSASETWSKLFKTKPLPVCSGHKQQSVLKTVKKSGENQGRRFYSCARPVGAPGDKTARCTFFQWAD